MSRSIRLPDEFWENERRLLAALLVPRFAAAIYAALANTSRAASIGFDPAQYNRMAEQFAREQTDGYLLGFKSSYVSGAGDAIADWIKKPGATIADLDRTLGVLFSPERAHVIAVTETTRAFAQGQKLSYVGEGIKRWKWTTNRDDLVCPICGKINNRVVEIGEPFDTLEDGTQITEPPAHPKCRCWVRPVV